MPTTFAAIRRLARALLGDSDVRKYRYTDEVLNEHFRLAITLIDEPAISEDSDSESFTEELNNRNKLRVALRSALNIVAPLPDEFSHKSPVFSVTRKGGVQKLRVHLEQMLSDVESGGSKFAVSVDYSLDALVNEITRTIDSLDHALASS